jgi:hypothetical protein
MSPPNKKMQRQKNCQLYTYLLLSQEKEVPDLILECAHTYDCDYPVDCVRELTEEIKGLDSETFERIVNNKESKEARELAHWWEMHQEAERLHKDIAQTYL